MPARFRQTCFLTALLLLAFVVIPDSFARELRGKPIVPRAKGATTANAAPSAASPAKPSAAGDYVQVSFDTLAGFTFAMPEGVQPDPATNAPSTSAQQIPAEVKAYDQKKVALTGFMLPLKVDDGLVSEMLIMKDQSMCCYGTIPRINDWVSVKMKKGGVKSVMDQAVTLYGKLKVGEMLENGYLVGIYEMEGDKMDEPKE